MSKYRSVTVVSWFLGLTLWCFSFMVWSTPVEITYTNWFSGASQNTEIEIVQLFNEIHPDIQVKFVPVAGSQVLLEKIMIEVAARVGPDVAALRGVTIGPNLESLAMDITAWVQRDNFNLDQFVPVTLELGRRQGRLFGLPWGFGGLVLYHNQSMFANVGLSVPTSSWTTKNFTEYARRLTVDRDGDRRADQWGIDHLPNYQLYLWGQLFGGRFVSPDGMTVAIKEQEFMDALEWVRMLVQDAGVVRRIAGVAVDGRLSDEWLNGASGMVVEWEGYINNLVTNGIDQRFQWGTSYMPRAGNMPNIGYAQWHLMSIIQGSRHPEAAWEFLKFYNSDAMQELLGKQGSYPTSKRGRVALGMSGPLPPQVPRMDIYAPIVSPPELRDVPWQVTGLSSIWGDLETMFGNIIGGREAVQTAVDRLSPILNSRLADARATAQR